MVLATPLIVALVVVGAWEMVQRAPAAEEFALDGGSGGGVIQPLPYFTPVAIGSVRLNNVSDEPVQLVSARLVHKDQSVRVVGFAAHPGPSAPLTALEWPIDAAVPIHKYPPLLPSRDGKVQAVILVGLEVSPGKAGKAVGVAVTYRQDGVEKEQIFEENYYVCSVPEFKDNTNCPGVGSMFDVFGDFEDEVRGESDFVIPTTGPPATS